MLIHMAYSLVLSHPKRSVSLSKHICEIPNTL